MVIGFVSNGVYYIIDGAEKLFKDVDRANAVGSLFRSVIEGLNATLYKAAPVLSPLLQNLKNFSDTLSARKWVNNLKTLASGEIFRDEEMIPIAPGILIPNVFRLVRAILSTIGDLLTSADLLNTMNLPVLPAVAGGTANIPLLGAAVAYTLVNLNWIRGTTAISGFLWALADSAQEMWRGGFNIGISLKVTQQVARLASLILSIYFAKQYVVCECVASGLASLSLLARELISDYNPA